MTHTQPQRPRGRPPLDEAAMLDRLNIRLPKQVRAALDRVRDKRQDGSDTAQVVREALVYSLKAWGEL